MASEPLMDPDQPNQYMTQRSSAGTIFWLFLVVAVFASLLAWRLRDDRRWSRRERPAPTIEAEGWLNGEPPTAESLKNRVIFVEAWATWCGPCRKHAPHLVKLHEKYANRGVIFIGLTAETGESLQEINLFLKTSGITWLNGWGARKTLSTLNAEYIPHGYIIGANGMLVWDSSQGGSIEEGAIRS